MYSKTLRHAWFLGGQEQPFLKVQNRSVVAGRDERMRARKRPLFHRLHVGHPALGFAPHVVDVRQTGDDLSLLC